MCTHGESVEAVRASYRPKRILTLFVGESAPQSGAFFYYNNTAMSRNVERAMKAAGLRRDGNFLECFKAYGWYLDDFVLTPVNGLERPLRSKKMSGCVNLSRGQNLRISAKRKQPDGSLCDRRLPRRDRGRGCRHQERKVVLDSRTLDILLVIPL
jgi:hypothetical protein